MQEIVLQDFPAFLLPDAETVIGDFTFTEEIILKFATQYDPQRFHLDYEQAKQSIFGGLCASGWQTVSVWMRLQRRSIAEHTQALKEQNQPWPEFGPSPGMKNLRWMKPVYVDQTITYVNHIQSLRQSNSKPEWWIMANQARGENDAGERVMQFESSVFIKLHR